MESISSFAQRIPDARLTAKEAVVADYILNHFSTVSYISASELARQLGLSDATVNRTCKDLGYHSFAQLQEELRHFTTDQAEYARRVLTSPFERLQKHKTDNLEQDFSKRFSNLVADNLQNLFQKNSPDTLQQAQEILATSRTKYIVGYRPTADIASKFAFLLRMTIPGVVQATGNVSFEQLLDVEAEDCLFLIDFNQYSLEVDRLGRFAKEKGAKIILLTDRPTAPLAQLADVLLLVDVYGISFFNSNVAALFLLELLVAAIADRHDSEAEGRLDTLNPYFDSHRIQR